MTDLENKAKEWAEKNSSPGKDGRNELYEVLIECQAQGYQAGYEHAIEECAQHVERHVMECDHDQPDMTKREREEHAHDESVNELIEQIAFSMRKLKEEP